MVCYSLFQKNKLKGQSYAPYIPALHLPLRHGCLPNWVTELTTNLAKYKSKLQKKIIINKQKKSPTGYFSTARQLWIQYTAKQTAEQGLQGRGQRSGGQAVKGAEWQFFIFQGSTGSLWKLKMLIKPKPYWFFKTVMNHRRGDGRTSSSCACHTKII